MGGYGVLKNALKECDKFCAGAGLSSVANIKTELFKDHLNNLLNGNTQIVDEDDLCSLLFVSQIGGILMLCDKDH